ERHVRFGLQVEVWPQRRVVELELTAVEGERFRRRGAALADATDGERRLAIEAAPARRSLRRVVFEQVLRRASDGAEHVGRRPGALSVLAATHDVLLPGVGPALDRDAPVLRLADG